MFPGPGRPRVCWLGLAGEMDRLVLLKNKIEQVAAPFGFAVEKRTFKPHLTLGRIKFIKERNNFYSLIQRFEEKEIQIVKVTEIIFYRSILNSSGPVYKSLKTVQLKL